MKHIILIALGILIPLFGTTLGAAMALLLRHKPDSRVQKFMLGSASGVMIAASVWSLLIPSIEMAESNGVVGWIPAVTGFLLGVGGLLVLDRIIPCECGERCIKAKKRFRLSSTAMLALAVTLHNIPEGMAVGVVFAGADSPQAGILMAEAFALSIGIAIQNLPEGMIISMPMVSEGSSKRRSFMYGFLSGVVEPIGAVVTLLLTSLIVPILPYILAFAAGAMIYVVINELIPEAQEGTPSGWGTGGAAIGFSFMMLLDVALG